SVLIVSLVMAIAVPLYDVLFVHPSFTKLLIETAKRDGENIVRYLASVYLSGNDALNEETLRATDLLKDVKQLKANFQLQRFKVFSKSGEIIFSTDPEDLGNVNKQKYFRDRIAKGKTQTEYIQKNHQSLDGQKMTADVVETYIPLMSGGRFLGAFEIYYDITDRKKQLDRIVSRSSYSLFSLACGLATVVTILLIKENKVDAERNHAQEKQKSLILELQKALAEVKTLSGMLPICAGCKKVRDDKGYWKQIESYLLDHSEAKFSHGICPECAKKLYPDLIGKEVKDS
ncbi:MAG: hypothetical protein JSW26_11850, partial [Desulfobacterales bacterium]